MRLLAGWTSVQHDGDKRLLRYSRYALLVCPWCCAYVLVLLFVAVWGV
jgi:hypothetical protein